MLDDGRWHRPDPDLWTYRVPLRVLGFDAGRRGVAVRYAEGRWAFLGPVPLDAAARRELDDAGRVDVLVVPTAFHNTFVPEACAAFPGSMVYAARGARTKDLPTDRVRRLPSDLPAAVRDALGPFPLEGMRAGHEVLFVHGTSGSVIVADLCMHYPEPARTPWTRLRLRAFGWTPGPRVPSLMKLMIRNRATARATLEAIRRQIPRRIVMAHGVPIERDVDTVLEDLIRQLG